MTPEQEQAIADLRTRNVSPKQIARQLGLRPAEVSAVIKAQAVKATAERVASGELNPLHRCLVNTNGWAGLTTPPPEETDEDADVDGADGFALVIVSRLAGFNRLEVASFLVDIWCLGVKDAMPTRTIDVTTYKEFVEFAYEKFPTGYEEISLEQAQAIVFGGVAYAESLGFQPHRDFAQAKAILGEQAGDLPLHFGRNGKPYFINGPHDDDIKILHTLRENVGDGNFHYTMMLG